MSHLLVIGGSDAGISAALRAREVDPVLPLKRRTISLRILWDLLSKKKTSARALPKPDQQALPTFGSYRA